MTRASAMLGTGAYVAPEQINETAVTPRTAVYAAAVTLYELLCGFQPFAGTDTAQILRRILLDPAPRLPPTLSGVSAAMHEALARALFKDSAERLASAGELASLLAAGAHQVESGAGPMVKPSHWQGAQQPQFMQPQPVRHPSGPQNPGGPGVPQPAPHPSRPVRDPMTNLQTGAGAFPYRNPPNLPWVVVLLIALLTGGTGLTLWEMNVARWLERVEPASGASTHSVIAVGLFACYWLMLGLSKASEAAGRVAHDAGDYSAIADVALIAYAVMVFVLRMNMRRGIEQHFNTAEPIGLGLSGPMTFFFGGTCFSYQFNRINAERARMGRVGSSV